MNDDIASARGQPMDLPNAIEVIRPSIVQVRIEPRSQVPGGDSGCVIGTGFWVHKTGLVLTARHVTRSAQQIMASLPGSRLCIGLAIPNLTGPVTIRSSFELIEVDLAEEDPRHDIALLRAATNPFLGNRPSGVQRIGDQLLVNPLYGLPTLSDSSVVDGEFIAVSGYPLALPALVTTSGGIASAFLLDVQNKRLPGGPDGFTIPDIADSYLADIAVNPGNSGGPVYRVGNASVIGVCVAFHPAEARQGAQSSPFFYNSGLSIIVPIKYGLELLSRHLSK